VEAILELTGEVAAADVERVTITMPGRADAFRDAAMPALNLRYLAAVIFIDGGLDFVAAQSLDRFRGDHAVRTFMDRVDVAHDPVQEAGPGAERTESARVTVTRRDGTTLERFVPHVLGFPSHPMPAAHVEAKARDLVAPHLGDDGARRLIEMCRDPGAHPASAFVAAVARPDRPRRL
jgi:2-methylcitrate dehydratase PrpD